jgi:hypothetical protein
MSEPLDQDPETQDVQALLRDGIERTRELCAETKRRLSELNSFEARTGPENFAQ